MFAGVVGFCACFEDVGRQDRPGRGGRLHIGFLKTLLHILRVVVGFVLKMVNACVLLSQNMRCLKVSVTVKTGRSAYLVVRLPGRIAPDRGVQARVTVSRPQVLFFCLHNRFQGTLAL